MNRKEITEWFLNHVNNMKPGNSNVAKYTTYLNSLNNKQFDELMAELKQGKKTLPYIAPVLSKDSIDIEKTLKVADAIGVNMFQRLILIDPITGLKYKTPETYLVMQFVVRRQAQDVTAKKSVAADSLHVDSLTGQASGPSKTAQLTLSELINLDSLGFTAGPHELLNTRGGNEKAWRYAKQSLIDTGHYTLSEADKIDSRPKVIGTFNMLLLGCYLQSNF